MNSGTLGINLEPSDHAPLKTCDPIAERPEARPKKHILLETISAPLAGDHLVLQRNHIEFGRTPEHDV